MSKRCTISVLLFKMSGFSAVQHLGRVFASTSHVCSSASELQQHSTLEYATHINSSIRHFNRRPTLINHDPPHSQQHPNACSIATV